MTDPQGRPIYGHTGKGLVRERCPAEKNNFLSRVVYLVEIFKQGKKRLCSLIYVCFGRVPTNNRPIVNRLR